MTPGRFKRALKDGNHQALTALIDHQFKRDIPDAAQKIGAEKHKQGAPLGPYTHLVDACWVLYDTMTGRGNRFLACRATSYVIRKVPGGYQIHYTYVT